MLRIVTMKIQEVEAFSRERMRQNFPLRYERAFRFKHRDDQLRCLGAGVLLHEYLQLEEADIRYNAYGKPEAPLAPFSFSLSHSGSMILLAVSDDLVGADTEQICRKPPDIEHRVFMREELDWIQSSPLSEEENFYSLWTLKESVMKAEGKGLSLDPACFAVLPALKGKRIYCPGVLSRSYAGYCLKMEDYIISCVTEKEEQPDLIGFPSKSFDLCDYNRIC